MNYIEMVADLFLRRNGNVLLSAGDYVIIAEWEKEEIPLEIILNSINQEFDNSAINNGSLKIESIGFFQDAIKDIFAKSL